AIPADRIRGAHLIGAEQPGQARAVGARVTDVGPVDALALVAAALIDADTRNGPVAGVAVDREGPADAEPRRAPGQIANQIPEAEPVAQAAGLDDAAARRRYVRVVEPRLETDAHGLAAALEEAVARAALGEIGRARPVVAPRAGNAVEVLARRSDVADDAR